MHNIQAIICFNGGAAGDFLTAVCNQQLDVGTNHYVCDNGMVTLPARLKICSQQIYNNIITWDDLHIFKFSPVENSHFYFDQFKIITPKLFFIDYADNMHKEIVKVFVDKRFAGNNEKFLHSVKPSFPEYMQTKLTADNVVELSAINWKRNHTLWKSTGALTPVNLGDFFDQIRFELIVKEITGLETLDRHSLEEIYNNWICRNNYLQQLFTK